MGQAVRWVGFTLGVLVAAGTFSSVVNAIVVPKGVSSPINYVVWRATRAPFYAVARRLDSYQAQDRLLGVLGPVSLLVLLGAWLVLFLFAYALMFWPLAGESFGGDLRLAGSSLFTLGLASSPWGAPTALTFLAAATGLVVVALEIGYLPTIYGAYNRRETLVNMLEGRAGEPAWGPELLAREQLIGGLDSLEPFFADWERWAADITETHVNFPWLMTFRSPYLKRSWVISLLAVMDAGAMFLALAPSRAPAAARHCLRTGFLGLRALAGVFHIPVVDDPHPDDPIQLTYEEFAEAVQRLEQAGFPLERPPEQAWRHFKGWRVNYEAVAYRLADKLAAVPAPWSGERQHLGAGTTLEPVRPPHRSPEDPEGARARIGRLMRPSVRGRSGSR